MNRQFQALRTLEAVEFATLEYFANTIRRLLPRLGSTMGSTIDSIP